MGSVMILCVTLLKKVFKINYSKQWLYIIWAVIAIRLIIPVNISFIDTTGSISLDELATANSIKSANLTADTNRIKPSDSFSEIENQGTGESIQLENDLNHSDAATQEAILKEKEIIPSPFSRVSLLDMIAVIWFVGAILFLLYHLGAYLNFRRKLSRWSTFVKNKEVLEQFHNLCSELKVKRQIEIRMCNQVKSPILIGLTKPCIVLPSKDFSMEQYYFILKHELIHYKHHDLYYKFLLLCTAAIHWFNPLIHYMVYLANNDMELYCDEKLIAQKNLVYRENYSKTLLQVITDKTNKSELLLSACLGSKNKQLKNRFFQIMNSKPTRKGTRLILGLVCLIVVIGNLTAWMIPAEARDAEMDEMKLSASSSGSVEMTGMQINPSRSESENQKHNTSDQLDVISNVLVVGIDGNDNNNSHADSILVVSVDPDTKKVSLISFLRDMHLQIPEHGKNKLGSVYSIGGTDLIKDTIETNFGISIDYTVTVDMKGFENIFNSIGGIELELSEEEAEYLNHTNYISDRQYRNVVAGKQILNGNQILGYLRVRKVPTIDGERGDIGRTARLRSLLSSVVIECSRKDIIELTKVITDIIPCVSTDLGIDQIIVYLNTLLQGDLSTDTFSIPVADSYTEKVQDGMSVIDVNLDLNRNSLQQIIQ